MASSNQYHAESLGSQHEDPFKRLKQIEDRKGSVHTAHTTSDHSRGGRRIPREGGTRAMQREIDQLKRKLRRMKRKRMPSVFDSSSESSQSSGYRLRSRAPSSETFSYETENPHNRADQRSSSRGLGSDAMGKALHQLSKSPFTRRIEKGKLPRHFTQPNFTIYNGRTDPVKHVSHFNQRMAVHSKNETLMCKAFPSSLGPVAMRWFNGLKANSINSYIELTMAFGSCFVTCSRVPRPLDSLLSMAMRETRENCKKEAQDYPRHQHIKEISITYKGENVVHVFGMTPAFILFRAISLDSKPTLYKFIAGPFGLVSILA